MTNPRTGQARGSSEQNRAGSTLTIPQPTHQTRPRLTGCPAGCLRHHEHNWIIHERCNYCTSLDGAARDAMYDCSDVCPLGRGQVA